jgi:hypothetical protein
MVMHRDGVPCVVMVHCLVYFTLPHTLRLDSTEWSPDGLHSVQVGSTLNTTNLYISGSSSQSPSGVCIDSVWIPPHSN